MMSSEFKTGIEIVETLIPNGFVSWNSSGTVSPLQVDLPLTVNLPVGIRAAMAPHSEVNDPEDRPMSSQRRSVEDFQHHDDPCSTTIWQWFHSNLESYFWMFYFTINNDRIERSEGDFVRLPNYDYFSILHLFYTLKVFAKLLFSRKKLGQRTYICLHCYGYGKQHESIRNRSNFPDFESKSL